MDDLFIAQIVALCPERNRRRAEELATEWLELTEEINQLREDRLLEESRQDLQQAIAEGLAAGQLVKDRDGRIRLR
jgi:nitrogen fixation/metabolism regulation signal transduction histidine kinase